MSEKLAKIYKRIEENPWQTLGGETIIISPHQRMSHEVTGVGSFIWEQIDGKSTLAEIIAITCDEYEVDPAEAQDDIIEFVETLSDKGLARCQN